MVNSIEKEKYGREIYDETYEFIYDHFDSKSPVYEKSYDLNVALIFPTSSDLIVFETYLPFNEYRMLTDGKHFYFLDSSNNLYLLHDELDFDEIGKFIPSRRDHSIDDINVTIFHFAERMRLALQIE
jgi:hypothetical protein